MAGTEARQAENVRMLQDIFEELIPLIKDPLNMFH